MLLVRYGARVRPADVVVVALPGDRPLVGQARGAAHGGGWWLEGDNAGASSADSRQLGRCRTTLCSGGWCCATGRGRAGSRRRPGTRRTTAGALGLRLFRAWARPRSLGLSSGSRSCGHGMPSVRVERVHAELAARVVRRRDQVGHRAAVLLGVEPVAQTLGEVERLAVDVVEADQLVLPVRRGALAQVDDDVEDRAPGAEHVLRLGRRQLGEVDAAQGAVRSRR